MSAVVQAILAAVSALLTAAPELFKDFQDLLNGHPSNPANGSLAQQVKSDTQAEEDSLGKL